MATLSELNSNEEIEAAHDELVVRDMHVSEVLHAATAGGQFRGCPSVRDLWQDLRVLGRRGRA